jgi:hypothetical protein
MTSSLHQVNDLLRALGVKRGRSKTRVSDLLRTFGSPPRKLDSTKTLHLLGLDL